MISFFSLQLEKGPQKEVGEYIYMDVCTPGGTKVTCELGVLEELQAVFNPEMAYTSYIPLQCLIGKALVSYHVFLALLLIYLLINFSFCVVFR